MLALIPHALIPAATLLIAIPPPPPPPPAPGHITPQPQRVAGDLTASVTRSGDTFRASAPNEPCFIDTPLPDGYPPPTPPGAIEIKHYPSVRRAEISGEVSPDLGMNMGFWPLFNHIKRRNIAMTSPVEMDYHTRFAEIEGLVEHNLGAPPAAAAPAPADQDAPTAAWTMSFLYRTADLGDTGEDGRIRIVDTPPLTVVAIGLRGSYAQSAIDSAIDELNSWLAANPAWVRDESSPPRAFFYNGPDRRQRDKWAEAHLPIKPAPPHPAALPGPSAQVEPPAPTPAPLPTPTPSEE